MAHQQQQQRYRQLSTTTELKQRLNRMNVENHRLMLARDQLVQETNRRVQLYLNEIRGLKAETDKMRTENDQLRDLCCFLDDDRQRISRISREWQNFGRYSNSVVRQQVTVSQEKLQQLERSQKQLSAENNELKQLCLYLDEQRRSTVSRKSDEGSGPSSDSETNKPESEQNKSRLFAICDSSKNAQTTDSLGNDSFLDMLDELKDRVNSLEWTQIELLRKSDLNLVSDVPIDQSLSRNKGINSADDGHICNHGTLVDSQTSAGTTSSGTTYASSNSDSSTVTAVYIPDWMEHSEQLKHLEEWQIRSNTLTPIDVKKKPKNQSESIQSLRLDNCHLSLSTPNIDVENLAETYKICRSQSLNVRRIAHLGTDDSLERLPKKEGQKKCQKSVITQEENALIQHMCQVAWESLDQKSDRSFQANHLKLDQSRKLRISAV